MVHLKKIKIPFLTATSTKNDLTNIFLLFCTDIN